MLDTAARCYWLRSNSERGGRESALGAVGGGAALRRGDGGAEGRPFGERGGSALRGLPPEPARVAPTVRGGRAEGAGRPVPQAEELPSPDLGGGRGPDL